MSYTWITPKTDWTNTTKFVYTDYNRIRNNLLYINDKINTDYPSKAQDLDLGNAKTGYTNEYYPSEFTAFEDALESFTRIGQDVNIGTRSYYKGNGEFISFDALNRLESCCLKWYTALNVTVQSISITPSSQTIIEEGTYNFTVSMYPASASSDNYTYTVQGATSAVTASKSGMTISLAVSELELQTITITVSYKNKTATANVKIGAGTWFIYNNQNRYYDFIYLGSDLDKSGVSTLLAHYAYGDNTSGKAEFEGCFGIEGQWGDDYLGENSEYMADIQAYVDKYFSEDLKEALQSVTKWMQRGYTDRYQYTSKFFLPSRDELMSSTSSSSIYTELKTVSYEYFSNSEQAKDRWNDGILDDGSSLFSILTRSIVDSAISGGGRRKNACIILSNNNYYYSSIYLSGFQYSIPIRPLFFLSNSLKVKQSSISGIDYIIDWTGNSQTTLSSIPVGSIVADTGYTGGGKVQRIIPETTDWTIPYWNTSTLSISYEPEDATNTGDLTVSIVSQTPSESGASVVIGSVQIVNGQLSVFASHLGTAVVKLKCGTVEQNVNITVANTASAAYLSQTRNGDAPYMGGFNIWSNSSPKTYYVVTNPKDAIDKDNYTYSLSQANIVSVSRNDDALTFTPVNAGSTVLTLSINGHDETVDITVNQA